MLMPRYLFIALFFSFTLSSFTQAEPRALLVGVGQYASVNPLEGPRHDVIELKKTLINKKMFAPHQIKTLIDQQATKHNIMTAVARLEEDTEKGDKVLIYYSGHGTSFKDLQHTDLFSSETTGLIPYDFPVKGSAQAKSQSLITGAHNLKPYLSRLDRGGRKILFLVDACYSALAYKSGATFGAPRYQDIDWGALDDSTVSSRSTEPKAGHPYENLVFLSASASHQPAIDVRKKDLAHYPTWSGNPHGVFTDALLRILNGQFPADANLDHKLDAYELQQGIAQIIAPHPVLDQDTQLRPTVAEDVNNLRFSAVLNNYFSNIPASAELARCNNALPKWAKHITKHPPPFLLDASLEGVNGGHVLHFGGSFPPDEIKISIRSEKAGRIQVWNLDQACQLNLIYPSTESHAIWQQESSLTLEHDVTQIPDENAPSITAQPPEGQDLLIITFDASKQSNQRYRRTVERASVRPASWKPDVNAISWKLIPVKTRKRPH